MATEIKTTLKKVASGLNWETVVAVVDGGMANVPSEIQSELDDFLEGYGLMDIPHVLVANHSMGVRDWKYKEPREPAFFQEPGEDGGWYVFTEGEVKFLYFASATSGSSLTAEEQEDGSWKATLEVPVDDGGQPYEGFYWRSFHEALSLMPVAA
jgi:hypothetical protein